MQTKLTTEQFKVRTRKDIFESWQRAGGVFMRAKVSHTGEKEKRDASRNCVMR